MRLEMVEESLVEKLKVVSEEQRRRAVKVACELALQGKKGADLFDYSIVFG